MVQSSFQSVLEYQMLIQNGPLVCQSEVCDVFNLRLPILIHLHQHWILIWVIYLGCLRPGFHFHVLAQILLLLGSVLASFKLIQVQLILICVSWVLTLIHLRSLLCFARSMLSLRRSEILTRALLAQSVHVSPVRVRCSILPQTSSHIATLRLHLQNVLHFFVRQLLLWMHMVT